jgi:hypothetical protein
MATVNPWQKFQQLLPAAARYIITVTAINADGTVSGATRDGAPVRVLAGPPVTAGARAWVEDGRIAGTAPTLPLSVAEV